MSTVYNDIDNFRKRSLEASIVRELNQLDNSDESETRKNQLLELLDELNDISKTKTDTNKELKEMFDTIEKQMHMQPWNKLQPLYKKEKINEYCQTKSLSKQVTDKLLELVDQNSLTSKYVNYKQIEQRIEEITLLTLNENDELDLDQSKIKKIVKK